VKFINTDGMAFIGPGSEWFWAAVSGVVLAVTFFAIYRQLRLQRGQAAIEQVEAFRREWTSERWSRTRLDALLTYRDTTDPQKLDTPSMDAIASYWENVALLVRRHYLDGELLLELDAGSCEPWWVILSPIIHWLRVESNAPTLFANFEWLSAQGAANSRRKGELPFTEERIRKHLDYRIATNRAAIRLGEALRSVPTGSSEIAPSAPTAPRPMTTPIAPADLAQPPLPRESPPTP
jgi:hypothetical protein